MIIVLMKYVKRLWLFEEINWFLFLIYNKGSKGKLLLMINFYWVVNRC